MIDVVKQDEGRWATQPVNVKEGILFSCYAPWATGVFVAGDFNGWKRKDTPLIKGKDDVWRVVLVLKPNRSHDYKFIVDGNWLNDPNNNDLNPDVAGGANSIIYLGSNGEVIPDGHPDRKRFTLEGRQIYSGSYVSTIYNQAFDYHYISPEYENRDRLPVVICLNNYIKSQELHTYVRENKFLAVIPSVNLGGQFIRQRRMGVFPELLDVIRQRFPIDDDRVFVTGMSYGGLEALLVSVYYPDLVAASAVVFGPYRLRLYRDKIQNMDKKELEEFLDSLDYPQRMLRNLKDFPLYISHGSGDEAIPFEEALTLYEIVKKLGAPTELTNYPEHGHTWYMVDEDLPRVFNWFKGFRRKIFPKKIYYTAPNGYFKNSIFWIDFTVDNIEKPVEIAAEISDDNEVRLSFTNIKGIKMKLTSDLLRLPGTVYIDTGKWVSETVIHETGKEIELKF